MMGTKNKSNESRYVQETMTNDIAKEQEQWRKSVKHMNNAKMSLLSTRKNVKMRLDKHKKQW